MSRTRIGLFLASALVLSAAALWLFAAMAERSVVRNAERQSLAWAEYASERITRIEELAQGVAATPDDLRAIAEMENFGNVFRFKLFGPDGALHFVSEDPLAAGPDLSDHNPIAFAVLETLQPFTVVADGSAKLDRPDLYSETYLPVFKDGQVVAIAEIHLDQTEARAAVRADYAAFGLAILALIMLGLAGPVIALVMVMRRLRENNRLLAAERERAVAADRLKTEFLANVSHELRTPLNGMIGLAGLLEDQQLDEEGREMLGVLQSSGNELVILIESMLNITRIESGDMKIESAPFDPSAILSDVAALFAPDARRKGLTLEVDPSAVEMPNIIGDQHAFRQIRLNLLGNAIKFTEQGEVSVRLDFDRQGDAGSLTFAVADTGIGIAEEDRARIFERFVRTREGINIGVAGTGLGLPIVRSIVELMGGTVSVDSAPGEGSTFTVTLPLNTADDDKERLAA